MSNGNLGVAQQRRGVEVGRLTHAIASIDRDLAQGTNGPNGFPSQYLAEHHQWLMAEKERLEGLIAELGALSPAELVERFVPEAKKVEGIPLRETLKRGDYSPGVQVVVHRDPPPTYRTGGNPGPVHPTQAPPGVTYTYDAGGNLTPM